MARSRGRRQAEVYRRTTTTRGKGYLLLRNSIEGEEEEEEEEEGEGEAGEDKEEEEKEEEGEGEGEGEGEEEEEEEEDEDLFESYITNGTHPPAPPDR